MARQVLHARPEVAEQLQARLGHRHAGHLQVACERVGRIDELEVVHRLGEPVDLGRINRQRLPHLACGAPAAVRDHIGGHRGAELAVPLVHVLDGPLAPIAARQVEIDVGPLAALLGEEALEEQIHADRIDGRDPEAVADGAVRGRPPALHEDVVLPAEIDDVPDNQEVAGEIELLDEVQLAGDLAAGAIVIRTIPLARPDLRHAAQERDLRLARGDGIIGETVAEIGHRVLQPIGELARRGDRLRQIAEQRRHLRRRPEVPLGVLGQPAPRRLERDAVMDAREDVEQRAILRCREPHAARGDDGDVIRPGKIDERVVVRFLVTQQVPLQLHVDVRTPEDAHQPIEQTAHAVSPCAQHLAPRKRDEARRVALELLERQRPFAFRCPQLHARDEAAQVAVAVLGLDEDGKDPIRLRAPGSGLRGLFRIPARRRDTAGSLEPGAWSLQAAGLRLQPVSGLRPDAACRLQPVACSLGHRSVGHRQLRAHNRPHAHRLRCPVKARGAVDAIPVEQRQRRIAEGGGPIHQRLGKRGALQKAEGGGGVEFDVGGHGWGVRQPSSLFVRQA